MLCPITLRVSNLMHSYRFPVKGLQFEQNWMICRQLIVFTGNILTLVYGIMIMISINWLTYQSLSAREMLCREIMNSAFSTSVSLIILSSFGCASIFIKRYSQIRTLFNTGFLKISYCKQK